MYPRFASPRLLEALEDSPVVLVHGPRQCGKTTLARTVGEPLGYTYVSFDDEAVLAGAIADPKGFLDDLPGKTILDEVQRAPGLFSTLKLAVDRDRRPGRFLLTGSANVLLVPKLADSLAGRLSIQAWPVGCLAWMGLPFGTIAPFWGNCLRPLSIRNSTDRPTGAKSLRSSFIFATGMGAKWTWWPNVEFWNR